MIPKLTRLHFILLILLLFTIGIYVSHKRHQKPKEKSVEKPTITVLETVPEKSKQDKEKIARKTIAIAGEYWKIAWKEYRDVTIGQPILRQAKVEYRTGNYDEAIRLAKQSIRELKSAKKVRVFYKVRSGDCLWNIAAMRRHYGKGWMWKKIWYANKKKIRNPRLIYPRQVLFIPGLR